jgi:hypothetical protein
MLHTTGSCFHAYHQQIIQYCNHVTIMMLRVVGSHFAVLEQASLGLAQVPVGQIDLHRCQVWWTLLPGLVDPLRFIHAVSHIYCIICKIIGFELL